MNKIRKIHNKRSTKVISLIGIIMAIVFIIMGTRDYQKQDGLTDIKYLIGVTQANMREAWRLELVKELQMEANKNPDVRLVITDATADADKQVKDIEELQKLGIDLLIISPTDTEEMRGIIGEVYKSIPVIVMDRAVEGYDYSLYIGPDNERIGRQAADVVEDMFEQKRANILEICGNAQNQSSKLRKHSFNEVMNQQANLTYEELVVISESKDGTYDAIMNRKNKMSKYQCIFAHNDEMAYGAYKALNELGLDIPVIGIDGFMGENKGIEMVQKGMMACSITCPTGGKEAIQYALDILNEEKGVPKQVILRSEKLTKQNMDAYLAKQNSPITDSENIIDVGFCQIDEESFFRPPNTKSIQDAAKDFGINLIFEKTPKSQEKQIEVIRKFIQMEVDVIAISPVVEAGWDEILDEIKESKIPLILSDRKIEIHDDTIITSYIGADFLEEGRSAMRWIVENVPSGSNKTKRIFELKGTKGASPTMERKKGFEEILSKNKNFNITCSKYADFSFEDGRETVANHLKYNGLDFDIIFAHNDSMALGAIEALEEYGVKPGEDVYIVSVDGTKEAFKAILDGELNCSVECSPLLGPQLMKAIKDMMAGKELPVRIITEEMVFDAGNAKEYYRSRIY